MILSDDDSAFTTEWELKVARKKVSALLLPATKLGQGYVFTRVCDSVHGGGSASVHAGIYPPQEQTP